MSPLKSIYIHTYYPISITLSIYIYIYYIIFTYILPYIALLVQLQVSGIIFIYKNYINTMIWSIERIKTKTAMFQENSNTLTNMAWKTRFKIFAGLSCLFHQNYIWIYSLNVVIKSAEIYYIFPKYTGFMEDLCSTGVKQTKLMVDFW